MNWNVIVLNFLFFVLSAISLIFLIKNIFYIESFFDLRVGIIKKVKVYVNFSIAKHLLLNNKYLIPFLALNIPLCYTLKIYLQSEVLGYELAKINMLVFLISRLAFLFWKTSQDINNLKVKSDLPLARMIIVEFSLSLIFISFFITNGGFYLDLRQNQHMTSIFYFFGLLIAWVSLMIDYHKQNEIIDAVDLTRYVLNEINSVNLIVMMILMFLPLKIINTGISYVDMLGPLVLSFLYINVFFILYAITKRHLPMKSLSYFNIRNEAKILVIFMINITVIIFCLKY